MTDFKSLINIAERKLIRMLLHVFCIFPVHRDRILFESYEGKNYSCNPKYLSEYIGRRFPGRYERIWAFKEPDAAEAPSDIRRVRYESLSHIYYRMTSGVIIQNMPVLTFIPVRKEQISINTWHAGGAYKKTGMAKRETGDTNPLLEYRRGMMGKQINLYLSSSKAFTKYNIRTAYEFSGPILKTGMPRNDFLFDEKKTERARNKIREKYGLRDYVVLYAPTYRGLYAHASKMNLDFPFADVENVLREKYGTEVSFLKRMHYTDSHKYADIGNVIDVSDYPDMQELLCAADLLVTDYSSSIWDFAILGRPCLLYVPDLDTYEKDPGFYVDISKWPGTVCRTQAELLDAAGNIDAEASRTKAREHLEMMGSYETGRACEIVCRYIAGKQRRQRAASAGRAK